MQSSKINNKVYIFGGYSHFNGVYFEDVYEFDINTCSWKLLELINPNGRIDHSMIAYNDMLVMFGGTK